MRRGCGRFRTGAARTRWPLGLALCLGGCVVEAEPGWQAQLARLVRPELLHADPGLEVPAPDDTDPVAGDQVLLAITLQSGGRTRDWRLDVRIDAVETPRMLEWRNLAGFELRVQPGEARRLAMERQQAEFRARNVDLEDMARAIPVARLTVEAFDEAGASLGRAMSDAQVHKLRRGLLPACRAGHRQREPMHGRVEAGLAAPMLTLADDAYDDVMTAGAGVALCEELFRILQSNPVTRQILREVLELPSLWSVLTNWGVRVSFTADFFAAERVDPQRFPAAGRELWSVPLVVLLNGEPGFVARVVVGPSGSPDGAIAGIHGVIARHPSDATRRVVVRLAASQRGARAAGAQPPCAGGAASTAPSLPMRSTR